MTNEKLEAENARLRAELAAAQSDFKRQSNQDVDDRRQGRAALTVQARHRAVFESAIDFAMVVTDPTGIITDWNPGSENVMGWTANEMIGQDANRFFTPEDRAAGQIEYEMSIGVQKGL